MTLPPEADSEHLETGALVAGRYEIVRRLGTGGMGTVYLARHREMDRACALKVLHPTQAGDREALERFGREARNASRIAHPNVCTIFDFGTTADGLVYLVMEYVDGRSLGSILVERGALPIGQAVALVEAIAAGLDAAHDLGIVHRDLKPDNVMVGVVGGRESVKLVDFGIAKALAGELDRDVTAPGIVVGTPDYMAPEQFAGDPADRRTDGYSLAVMFYRMVTGGLPFTGATARETLTQRLTEPPRPLSAAAPHLAFPPDLQPVLDRGLARRPEDRYASAGEFAAALRAVVGGPAVAADVTPTIRLDAATAPIAVASPPTRPTRSRSAVVGVLAGITLLTTIAVVLYRTAVGTAVEQRGPASPPAAAPPVVTPASTSQVLADSPASRPSRDSGRQAAPRRDTARAGATAVVPPPPGPAPGPAPVPSLPSPDEILNPETQDASRARAEQIYDRQDADIVMRAQAAFIVATIRGEQGRYAEAETWAVRAAVLNQDAPAGAERDRRDERYRAFINQIRKLRGTPDS
jgi:serine/threonine-protein kinase